MARWDHHLGKNFIDGQYVDGGEGWIDVENPASGELIAQQALASAMDVDKAVAAARRLIDSRELIALRPVERGRMVRAMGQYLLDHCDSIAQLLSRESGKPYWEAQIEIEGSARYFEYYGNQAETMEGRSIPLGDAYVDFTEHEPMGISAQIIPWNYPVEMAARSIAPALATGNACIIKSPELDPLSSICFAAAAEHAGLPPAAVQILCGVGSTAGAALASHKDIDQIVFTGSVATGTAIATAAAQNLVPCVLELGGKSAAIVRADADLDNLVENVRWGIFFNSGQVCSAMSRVLVHRDIHSEFIRRVSELATALPVQPGENQTETGASMGAMVSVGQRDRALGLVKRASDEGAQLICGGDVPRSGAFLAPTVFDQVRVDSELFQTEVFGPVLAVTPFDTDEEALAMANATEFGLVAGVFTQDITAAMNLSKRLRAGQVFVNEWFAGGVETPFGGYGKSGYGREKGREALLNYVQTKNVAIRLI